MLRTSSTPPRAEVWGGSLLGVARGLEAFGVPWPQVLHLLDRSGIRQPQAEAWYALPAYLAFMADVEEAHGRAALLAMGRAIPDTSRFPPELDALERALGLLDVAYQVNHRGVAIGRYHCEWLGPRHAEMLCENPYPCDLDRGIFERLMERFGGTGPEASVSHKPGAGCRRLGAKACRFDLRW
jgi:hypothetical protein